MMLYEKYISVTISRDFFNKVFNFLKEIKSEKDKLERRGNKILLYSLSRENNIWVSMGIEGKNIARITTSCKLPGYRYPFLSEYIGKTLSKFFNIFHYEPLKLTSFDELHIHLDNIKNFIDKIDLNKEDYEVFVSQKKFGLL